MNEDPSIQRMIHDLETDTATDGHTTDNGESRTAESSTREFHRLTFVMHI